jgi:transposase InsO family protein
MDQIPSSNISRWKNESFSDIVGSEYSAMDDDPEGMIALLRERMLVKSLIALVRVKNALIEYVKIGFLIGKNCDQARGTVVRAVERARGVMPLRKAVRYFRISMALYYLWSHQVKTRCLETVTQLCPRVYPNQLSKSEVKIISDMLQDPRYEGWPISAIAFEAKKKGILHVHYCTWYKYARILGIKRKRAGSRRKYQPGVRAVKPLSILHLDTTQFKPMDNSRVYIYLLMDNYSRFILAWYASLRCCGEDCMKNVSSAYWKYIVPGLRDSEESVKLISDGGPENRILREFTRENTQVDIEWLIAQGIRFRQSNSMIEAVNKTIKYRHLFRQDIPDFQSTLRHLERAIPEYNNRPHYSLSGLSPQEAFNGVRIDKTAEKLAFHEEYKKRIEENRNTRCANCE